MTFIEAPSRIDHVIHTFEFVLVEVGAREGDELVYEEVVELR